MEKRQTNTQAKFKKRKKKEQMGDILVAWRLRLIPSVLKAYLKIEIKKPKNMI